MKYIFLFFVLFLLSWIFYKETFTQSEQDTLLSILTNQNQLKTKVENINERLQTIEMKVKQAEEGLKKFNKNGQRIA